MNTLRITFIAAALLSASAYANAAAPHWTAAIGTGQASDAGVTATATSATGQPSEAHWAASIGTGNATHQAPVKASAPGVVVAGPHWTSKIGTGHTAG